MEQFAVRLEDGQPKYLRAERYPPEGEHYVFDRPYSEEITFFVVADFTGTEEVQQSARGSGTHLSGTSTPRLSLDASNSLFGEAGQT